MRCPNCAGSVEERVRRCRHCGADLHRIASATTMEGPPIAVGETLQFPPGKVFARRFTIVEQIGRGGMGVVYKALDGDLGQTVALKLILPKFAAVPAFTQRFRREVRLARQISHPNVCRVFDLGEEEGVLYLSMEWIDGETLGKLLRQAGRLGETRALEIAEKISGALEAAHARGIIHRDLKPGNVMVDNQGGVHVMDFGLATDTESDQKSAPSGVVGTPPYIPPEQARGESVDGRADLYALGLILREMLTGRRETGPGDSRAQFSSGVNSDVSPVLRKLLAEDRERRYGSAGDTGRALRKIRRRSPWVRMLFRFCEWVRIYHRPLLIWGTVNAVILAAALFLIQRAGNTPSPGQHFFENGLHYLREESETVSGLQESLQMFQRAREMDPDLAVAWAGAAEGYWSLFRLKWAESFREEAIVAVEKALSLDPDLPEAHNARGKGLIIEGDFEEAVRELRIALAGNRYLAVAWANLGAAYEGLGMREEGLAAIHRAIEIRPDWYRNYLYLGNFFKKFGEYEQAERAYRKASGLKEDSPMAWNNLGTVFLRTNRREEAIEYFRRSLEIANRAGPRSNLGTTYFYLGRFREAEREYRLAIELEPWDPMYWGNLGDALKVQGKRDEAAGVYLGAVKRAFKKALLIPLDPTARLDLALWCVRSGEKKCAIEQGALAVKRDPQNAEAYFTNAVIHSVLGNRDAALDWLEKAVKLGFPRSGIENDPDIIALKDHPRYRRILEFAS